MKHTHKTLLTLAALLVVTVFSWTPVAQDAEDAAHQWLVSHSQTYSNLMVNWGWSLVGGAR
jgi:hypothetical protein